MLVYFRQQHVALCLTSHKGLEVAKRRSESFSKFILSIGSMIVSLAVVFPQGYTGGLRGSHEEFTIQHD